jgi:hypothetical protein
MIVWPRGPLFFAEVGFLRLCEAVVDVAVATHRRKAGIGVKNFEDNLHRGSRIEILINDIE